MLWGRIPRLTSGCWRVPLRRLLTLVSLEKPEAARSRKSRSQQPEAGSRSRQGAFQVSFARPTFMHRAFLALTLCVLAAPALWGQTPAAQPPTFRADTHLVQVSVVVTDSRQNPVTDLKAGDFRVFEDGKEQSISLFSVDARSSSSRAVDVIPAAGATVSNQVPVSGGVTVILFDRLNTAWGDQAQ